MLNGSYAGGNFFLVAVGTPSVLVGALLLSQAKRFAESAVWIQGHLGPLGRRIASQPRHGAVILTSVVAIALGTIILAAGLFLWAQEYLTRDVHSKSPRSI
jgi:hypothetical protein